MDFATPPRASPGNPHPNTKEREAEKERAPIIFSRAGVSCTACCLSHHQHHQQSRSKSLHFPVLLLSSSHHEARFPEQVPDMSAASQQLQQDARSQLSSPSYCTERQDHPALSLIQSQTQNLPSFVQSFQALTTNEFKEPIGQGWEYLAVVVPPSESSEDSATATTSGRAHTRHGQHNNHAHGDGSSCCSHDHVHDDASAAGDSDDELHALMSHPDALNEPEPRLHGPYKLRISLPADFPASPPRFRFASIIDHINITDMGLLVPESFWTHRLNWSTSNTIVDVLSMCAGALVSPYFPIPSNYNDIVEDWQFHNENHCPCIASECFPMSYPEFMKLSESGKAEAVQAFQRKLHDTFSEQQERAVRRSLKRQEVARNWLRLTGFPDLYDAESGWQPHWFAPSFLEAVRDGSGQAIRKIVQQEAPGVYSFDLFTPQFCCDFVRDLRLYEESDMPKYRPNSMNNFGLVINDMGMEGMIDRLMLDFLQPIVRHLFHDATNGQPVDQHHSFIVEYREGQDTNLDMHTDDSDVTFNVNICDEFQGAGLSFCGLHGAVDRRRLNFQYDHKLGRAVVHAGLHTHGADDLVAGERLNMIIWCCSSRFRQSAQFRERFARPTLTEEEPDLRCLSRTHDRDYQFWIDELTHPHRRDSDMS